MLLGADYMYFNPDIAPDFPARFGISAGIRGW
jgi:hypothetical protein